jgi:ribose 1,5-bisphosphokinase
MSGRFIAVVGPSGVGKDSLIDAICVRRPDLARARRVITRAAAAGGEDHEAASPALFAARAAGGDFALHWRAHDLDYGIPGGVHAELGAGRDVLANLSRNVLGEAARVFQNVAVLCVTARPEVLTARLEARGRESRAEIARRLARPAPALPEGLAVIRVDNSGALDATVTATLAALYPAAVREA